MGREGERGGGREMKGGGRTDIGKHVHPKRLICGINVCRGDTLGDDGIIHMTFDSSIHLEQ